MRLIYDKAMTCIKVTVPDHLIEAVDAHAAELAEQGEQPNRSAAIRAIIRDWTVRHRTVTDETAIPDPETT